MIPLARRCHPFTAGAVTLAAIALSLIMPTAASLALVYAALVLVVLLSGMGGVVWKSLVAATPLLLLLFVMQGMLGDGARETIVGKFTLSQSGIAWTISQGLRLTIIITASLAFAGSFDPHRFLQAAIARHWPFGAAFLMVATLDAADTLRARAVRVREAQRARGVRVSGSLKQRIAAVPSLVFPLLLAVLTEADDRALALETRGLTIAGPRHAIDPPVDTSTDRLVRWASVAAVVAVSIWRLR